MTRSPIELFWTAKKTKQIYLCSNKILLLRRRPAVGDGVAGGGGGGGGVRKLRKSQLSEWESGRKTGWEEKVGGGRKSKQQVWEEEKEKKSGRFAPNSQDSSLCRQVLCR